MTAAGTIVLPVNLDRIAPDALAFPAYDPDLPTFEVWVNGRRFATTQIPAMAYRLLKTIESGRPTLAPPSLVVVNDRRQVAR